MNTALWMLAGLLAVVFALSGLMKLATPREKLIANGFGWAEPYSDTSVRLIGLAEVLGALGLIGPPLAHIAPILVVPAAGGLALIMAAAIIVHARRKENPMIAVNIVLLVAALVLAWGRLSVSPFPS